MAIRFPKARVVRDTRFKGRPYVWKVVIGRKTVRSGVPMRQHAQTQVSAYNRAVRKRLARIKGLRGRP